MRLLTLADGRNVARYRDPATGKQRQEGLDQYHLTTQAAREAWAARKAAELADAKRAWSLGGGAGEVMGVQAAVAAYGVAKPVARSTARSREPALRELVAYCAERGIRRVDDMTAPRLWRFRDALVARTDLVASTKNLRLVHVSSFLRWLVGRDLAPLLPVDKITALCQPLEVPHKAIDFLRPEEVQRLLACALQVDRERPRSGSRVAPLVLTLLCSGMRLQECLGLEWQEVDWKGDAIKLPAARCKTRRPRAIGFGETPTLGKLLAALHKRAGEPEAGRVWPGWGATHWREEEKRLRKAIGRHWTAHTLRRTCGTILTCAPAIFGGASAFLSARRLGHSVTVAEASYAGALVGLPAEARTLEAAAGIEGVAEAIVAAES